MENVKLTQLDNGMKVITRTMESLSSVAIGYWVKAGGVFENPSNWGISHFLEHMAFKGTTTRTAQQIADEIESVGGYLNAYTSKEVTAFHSKLLGSDKAVAMDILSDILLNPTFLQDELERERGVILQEFFQTRDTPDDIIFDHFQRVAFGEQSLGMPILGTEERISGITSENLREYMSRYYRADNIIFAAAGNVSHEEILENFSHKYFEKFDSNPTEIPQGDFSYIGGHYSDVRDIEQVHAIVGFEGISSKDPDYYTLAIFSSILGGGMSSRLFQEIREKRGLVYSIYSFSNSYAKNGVFGVYAATTSDKLMELSEVLAVELLKMQDNIDEKEFKRTKAQFKTSLLISAENNMSSCEQLVNQTAIFGHPISRKQILEKIEAVTMDDVKDIAKKILHSKTSVVTVGKCDCSKVLKSLETAKIKV